MRNISENVRNSRRGSGLYCVWVPVHDDGGDRLMAIWIDQALTAFGSCAPETWDAAGTAATHFAIHQEENVDQFDGEPLTSMLPRRS